MPIDLRNVGMGFLAGAMAVLTAHQLVVYALSATGIITARPWSMHPVGPFDVPALLNSAFWGGVWGAIFALIASRLPATKPWSKGLDLRNVGMGFLAGAMAVLTAHQLVVYALSATGIITARPWSMHPVGPFDVPALLNSAFWGGVWGAIFALIASRLPATKPWSKG